MAELLSLLFKKPFFAFVVLKHKQFVYLISFSYYNEINQIPYQIYYNPWHVGIPRLSFLFSVYAGHLSRIGTGSCVGMEYCKNNLFFDPVICTCCPAYNLEIVTKGKNNLN
jgi:hypothetical protein